MKRKATAFLVAAILSGFASSLATAEQVVYLNFGSLDQAQDKPDKKVYREDDLTKELFTVLKGPLAGFKPTEIGYANNDTRDAIIQQIVNQVKADYAGFNVSFTLTQPGQGPFSTVYVLTGKYPKTRYPIGETITAQVDPITKRATLMNAGALSGYYVNLTNGKIFRPNGEETGDDFPDAKSWLQEILGTAQELDKGNKNKGRHAWVWVGQHTTLSAAKNTIELGNTISHELGHLVGLEHTDDDDQTHIMNGAYDGTDKSFSDTSKKKLKAVLPKKTSPLKGSPGPRLRTARVGDTDQFGTAEPAPATGNPDFDAAQLLKAVRSGLDGRSVYANFPFALADVHSSASSDGPYTDSPLPNGTTATFQLDLTEGGLEGLFLGAWIELDVLNVADVLGGANDLRVFVDGIELPGALDGLDQRLTDPQYAGYAGGQTITLFLDNYLTLDQLQSVLADGVITLDLQVDGATGAIAVDSVQAFVGDRGAGIVADVNNDGFVNVDDLLAVIGAWGPCGACPEDIDGDGVVDVSDLLAVINNWD